MKARQAGFTLVEIAIVLVIIGLLLGGILKGQEMITQAKIKNVIADFSGVSAAYHCYLNRYRANAADESRLWWDHLRRAGFVSGNGTQQPFNALTGLIGVQTGDGQAAVGPTMLNAAGGNGFVGLIMCSANLPDKIAIAVDTQMDDGASNLGTVRALLQAAPNPAIGAAQVATAAYAETSTNIYTLC